MSHPDDDDPLRTLQYMFDHFSADPGALIYRGPEVWQALPPGNVGDILELEMQPSGLLLPRWRPPS